MPTTRHHINRQRRRQAREPRPDTPEVRARTAAPAADDPKAPGSARPGAGVAVLPARAPSAVSPPRKTERAAPGKPAAGATPEAAPDPDPVKETDTEPLTEAGPEPVPGADTDAGPTSRRPRTRRSPALVVLCLLTLVLGGFAGWAHGRAQNLRDDPAVRNTALTDPARTSEIKGQTEKAVAALFSYDHADPAAYDKAVKTLLTGKAVAQHRALLDTVRTRADQQKAVITTTVTDSAVERVDGDRARVLVYADQSSVSTAGSKAGTRGAEGGQGAQGKQAAQDQGTYAGAMFAVDVVLRDGHWLVSGIDTFGR
ncbi:hypothetical protein ABZ719_22150 [Streptomyces sp. NPDC006743]|uniref:hypothetical protein n=1 Tax=Streptomyces sp. NPDC006743 TaxID=3154480 RepID=UPI0034561494